MGWQGEQLTNFHAQPLQDFKRTWHELKNMLKVMLEKKWFCNLFEIIS